MFLSPAILAIIVGSLLVTIYAGYASLFGLQVVRHWDLRSGSERQLKLERRTHLISTIVAYLFGLSLFSTFLFVYTGDHLHTLFVGAMCAAGTLNANTYGYPLLVIKILNFFLCGLWLVVNHTDGQCADYPLIRPKYRFLAIIAALLALETVLTLNYFGALKADVITFLLRNAFQRRQCIHCRRHCSPAVLRHQSGSVHWPGLAVPHRYPFQDNRPGGAPVSDGSARHAGCRHFRRGWRYLRLLL